MKDAGATVEPKDAGRRATNDMSRAANGPIMDYSVEGTDPERMVERERVINGLLVLRINEHFDKQAYQEAQIQVPVDHEKRTNAYRIPEKRNAILRRSYYITLEGARLSGVNSNLKSNLENLPISELRIPMRLEFSRGFSIGRDEAGNFFGFQSGMLRELFDALVAPDLDVSVAEEAWFQYFCEYIFYDQLAYRTITKWLS